MDVDSQDIKLEYDDDKRLLHWSTMPPSVESHDDVKSAKVETVKAEPDSGDDLGELFVSLKQIRKICLSKYKRKVD